MPKNIPDIGPIPAIGLGTWRLFGAECEQSVKLALQLGYRHIDTADYYDNHVAIGHAIKGFPREELFLVTKILGQDLHPNHVRKNCNRFLQELNTPYLDLLLIHWPSPDVPAEQTLEAMVKLIDQQLVRYIGVSNFTIAHLQEIEKRRFPILTNQIELHPQLQEIALVDYCQQKGIIVTAYRPILKGDVNKQPLLNELGAKYKKTPIQITLRWIFQRNIVSIPKASSKEHLQENIAIFDFSLSKEEMKAIASLDIGKRYVND